MQAMIRPRKPGEIRALLPLISNVHMDAEKFTLYSLVGLVVAIRARLFLNISASVRMLSCTAVKLGAILLRGVEFDVRIVCIPL